MYINSKTQKKIGEILAGSLITFMFMSPLVSANHKHHIANHHGHISKKVNKESKKKDKKKNKQQNDKNTPNDQNQNSKDENNSTNINVKHQELIGYGKNATGGQDAPNGNIFHVSNLAQLKNALSNKVNGSRVVYIDNNIDGNDGMTAQDYAKDTQYNLNSYLNAYNPNSYGKNKVSGFQEEQRQKVATKQSHQIEIKVPNNTSIIGNGHSQISNINFIINGNNVIMKNLHVIAPIDFFPQWDPKDGKNGNWNSNYDAITIKGGTNIWLNHNTFEDGNSSDKNAPNYFGRQYQQHDGLVDISNGADYITANYNVFANHDKTMLIGSSDKKVGDTNKLHVTLADNYFHNTIQRTPRVRFGTVDVVNNYYQNDDTSVYKSSYQVGAGYKSNILVKNNVAEIKNGNIKHFISNKHEYNLNLDGNIFNGQNINNYKTGDFKVDSGNNNVLPTNEVKNNVLKNSGYQVK